MQLLCIILHFLKEDFKEQFTLFLDKQSKLQDWQCLTDVRGPVLNNNIKHFGGPIVLLSLYCISDSGI